MEYLTFVEELKKHILKNEKWNISEENYKFYPDGYNAESDIEKEFIRNTNVKYNRVESDTLIGDFLNLRAEQILIADFVSKNCTMNIRNMAGRELILLSVKISSWHHFTVRMRL